MTMHGSGLRHGANVTRGTSLRSVGRWYGPTLATVSRRASSETSGRSPGAAARAGARLLLDFDESTRELDVASLENEIKYAGYLKQELARAERMRQAGKATDSGRTSSFPVFQACRVKWCSGSRRSGRKRWDRPSRIPGITPAAIAVLGAYLRQVDRTALEQSRVSGQVEPSSAPGCGYPGSGAGRAARSVLPPAFELEQQD